MPEGDTVFRVARYLHSRLAGRPVREVRIGRGLKIGQGCRTAGGALLELRDRAVVEVVAQGKHLWIAFEGGVRLRSHLGLHGSWHRYEPDEPWRKPEGAASLVLRTDEDVLVCFYAREVECLREGGFRQADVDAALGPDLSADEVDPEFLPARARRLLSGDVSAADLLLDQRVAAGIGNVYKSELLFLEGVSPFVTLAGLSDEAVGRLFSRASELLKKNLGSGPRTTRFIADGCGRLWVYGRTGKPCLRCGTPIRYCRAGTGQRSTYWCPECQARGGAGEP